jgi:hypothetical protein
MYRAVEGQVHYWWVGLGNIIGSTLLALVWDDLAPAIAINYDKINLLKALGPQAGLLTTYVMLAISLLLVLWWERHFFNRKQRQQAVQASVRPAVQ